MKQLSQLAIHGKREEMLKNVKKYVKIVNIINYLTHCFLSIQKHYQQKQLNKIKKIIN